VSFWREVPFAVVDLETTGTDYRRHEVLSIGIVPIDGGRITAGDFYYQTVRPTVAPERRTVVVHGIRPVDSAGAQFPADVAHEVEERLQGRVLVAHVADMERSFLNRWLIGQHGDALTTAQLFLATASLLRPSGVATLSDLRRVPLTLELERFRRRITQEISRWSRS
jgi:DNA polymerase III alpha subunit (gram-positive type)